MMKTNKTSLDKWCRILSPPPLPGADHQEYLGKIRSFIYSNPTWRHNFEEYQNVCGELIPDINTDRTRPTKVYSTTYSTTEASYREVRGEAPASAGMIVGVVILLVVVVIFVVVVTWWWLKKRQRTKQSSKALSMDEYTNTNYLHNKAVKKVPWNSSSAEEGNISPPPPQTNGTPATKPDEVITTANGGHRESGEEVASRDKLKKLKLKPRPSAEFGSDNICFTPDENGGIIDPESPDKKSVKSDTPLIDSIDGLLPNQAMTADIIKSQSQSSVEGGGVKGGTYGSTSEHTQLRGNRLPPVEKRPKKSPKKKRRSLVSGVRKSEPCQNTTDLAEDLAENRKSV